MGVGWKTSESFLIAQTTLLRSRLLGWAIRRPFSVALGLVPEIVLVTTVVDASALYVDPVLPVGPRPQLPVPVVGSVAGRMRFGDGWGRAPGHRLEADEQHAADRGSDHPGAETAPAPMTLGSARHGAPAVGRLEQVSCTGHIPGICHFASIRHPGSFGAPVKVLLAAESPLRAREWAASGRVER